MKVKNTIAAAVVIDGRDVIAPLAVYECADNHKGVQELIADGVLRKVDAKTDDTQDKVKKGANA